MKILKYNRTKMFNIELFSHALPRWQKRPAWSAQPRPRLAGEICQPADQPGPPARVARSEGGFFAPLKAASKLTLLRILII